MFNLGLMYEKRRGVSAEIPEADLLEATRECYEAAAEAGVTKAMVRTSRHILECGAITYASLPCPGLSCRAHLITSRSPPFDNKANARFFLNREGSAAERLKEFRTLVAARFSYCKHIRVGGLVF